MMQEDKKEQEEVDLSSKELESAAGGTSGDGWGGRSWGSNNQGSEASDKGEKKNETDPPAEEAEESI